MRRGLVGNIYVIKTIYLICVHDLMTDLRPDLADDEIDLRELFAVLWRGKWLIFSLCFVALEPIPWGMFWPGSLSSL